MQTALTIGCVNSKSKSNINVRAFPEHLAKIGLPFDDFYALATQTHNPPQQGAKERYEAMDKMPVVTDGRDKRDSRIGLSWLKITITFHEV